jgi:thiosulfate/3-mercaptopyruvate sulfurtransferase
MTCFPDLIDVVDLKSMLPSGNCRVIDTRFDLFDAQKGPTDYLAGHIPGASFAHMDDDLASAISPTSGRHPLPEVGAFIDKLRAWGVSNDSKVVVYDYANSSLAVRLWWMLKFWLGHEQVAVLDGGIAAWSTQGGSLESGSADVDKGNFSATANTSVIATTEEISLAVDAGEGLHLIDARDAARFRGDVEPIDTVAGHVPGARNLPLGVNLAESGLWRSPEALRHTWLEFLAEGPDIAPVVMCGSGVTACHLVLSAHLAGLPAPRVYVGSWSEWIRDENRPVEVEEPA